MPAWRLADGSDLPREFHTTRWTLVLEAGRPEGDAAAALARLCQDYWYPLYAFARRQGMGTHDAQDVTQGFFLHMIESGMLARADVEKGRFRTFLLGSLAKYLANEHRRSHAQKRGGGVRVVEIDAATAEERFALEPADAVTPETQFERSWAFALLDRVLARLGADYAQAGRAVMFEKLRPYLAGSAGLPAYDTLSAALGMSAGTMAMAVHRMRRRFAELMREEIAHTVDSVAEVDAEIAHLMAVVARG